MKKINFVILFKSFLVLTLAVSTACSRNAKKKTTESESFYIIPFAEIKKNQREVKLSEFATDVEIIQMENIPEAMLANVEDIEFTKDYIFVKYWMHPVLQFSRNGEFIRNIGSKGKGPGEYGTCLKMSVDKKNERIYIQTMELSMMVFNFDGEYLKTIQFPALESMMNFWICGRDSTLVSYFEPYSGNEPFVFAEYNAQGDTLQSIPNYIFWNKNEEFGSISPYAEQNFAYRFENKLHLKGAYNDTIYTYNENNKFVPKFFIDLGKHKLPEDFIYERKWKRPLLTDLCWTGVHETSAYIFLPYGYHFDQNKPEAEREEKGLVVYNKKTDEGVAVKETKQAGFTDDLTGGPDFRPTVTNGNTALMLISALDMKQYLESDDFKSRDVKFLGEKEKLTQLNKTLKAEDNHFLVLVNIKI
ncbi:MAG: 6-bladed beta-propeller [Mariniphaga sp.]|nr:6-bladed beta-propeller [Mariniphaga sp.]